MAINLIYSNHLTHWDSLAKLEKAEGLFILIYSSHTWLVGYSSVSNYYPFPFLVLLCFSLKNN
jgi:hypothetical protein